jgi:hypothetical protein
MTTDVSKIVLLMLGFLATIALVGIVGLSWQSKPIPDVLPAIVLATVTGSLGLIGKQPGVQEVSVVNKPADPVRVDPV